MRAKAVLVAAVLAMSTSGCWFQAGVGPNRTAFNDLETTITTANVSQLVPDWTASLGGPIGSEPLVDGAAVYARSDGRVSSFDLGTGATRWSVVAGKSGDVAGGSAAVPALDDGWLWVPTPGQACTLLQINPADGTTAGQRVYNGLPADQVPPSAVHLGGCRTGDALAAGSWIVVPSTVQMAVDSSSLPGGPACSPGVDLFITSVRLTAIDLPHDQGWALSQDATACGTPPATGVPFQGASQSGDQLVVARGSVVSAYPLAGCPFRQPCPATWSVDTGVQIVGAPVVLSNGDIAVQQGGGTAVIDGTSHAVEWTASVASSFPLAATPTSIYVVSSVSPGVTTILSALPADGCGASTCTPTWTATLPSGPNGRASIGGDVVYVGHGRIVSALPAAGCGAETCVPLWDGTTTTTQGISSPPVVDNGELLAGNRAGTLAAFALPG